jgi:tetratricopeptide (TPR) repeat protein
MFYGLLVWLGSGMGLQKSKCVFAGIIALMVVTGFAGPAAAQQQNCTGNSGIDWDIQIGACTAEIQSGRWQGKDLAFAFNSRGLAYANKGQYDRAIQDYDQAIKLNPNHANTFSNRGLAYDDKGQHDRAIQDYDQAIKLNPNHANAFNNRGVAYANKGQYDRAIQDYDQAIKLNPNNANTFYSRGNVYANKGQYDRAIQDYDQAIRLNPNHTLAITNRAKAIDDKNK